MPAAIRPSSSRRGAPVGLTLGIAALLVGACTGDSGDATPPTQPDLASPTTTVADRLHDGQLHIGVYLPRTGPGAQFGEPMITAIDDAVSAINAAGGVLGSPVRVTVADEASDAGPTPLLDAGVDAIVGPASSNIALSQLGDLVRPHSGVVTCSPMATSLALDEFPDNGYFFRTVPSDSLQMSAIAGAARDTGFTSVAVAYLDDPYGRGLFEAFTAAAVDRNVEIVAEVAFGVDDDNLSVDAVELVAPEPGVVVVLGDADDGSRMLAALDTVEGTDSVRRVIVNDAIRSARTTIQSLSDPLRGRLRGVAPLPRSYASDGPTGFFAANAVDCVNLIALSAVSAGSDDPALVRARIVPVGSEGQDCSDFETCAGILAEGREIDFNGASGSLELANSSGDPQRAWFESFGFDADGLERNTQIFEVN